MKEPSAVEILTEAKNLISDPSCWTQNSMARDCNGATVNPVDPNATCWCASGALFMADYSIKGGRDDDKTPAFWTAWRCLSRAATARHDLVITQANDLFNHPTVMRLYDDAIELAK